MAVEKLFCTGMLEAAWIGYAFIYLLLKDYYSHVIILYYFNSIYYLLIKI